MSGSLGLGFCVEGFPFSDSGESLARWFWIIFLQVCRWEKRWTVESFLQGDVDAVMKGVDMNSLVRVSCRVTSVQS